MNNGGEGRYFASKAEALAWVRHLQAEGRRNIDVGCMQVNLMHHPDAFADLEQALDPAANVAYGAGFLAALHAEVGSWPRAVERYHTAEPARGGSYRERVYANWDRAVPSGRIAVAGRAMTGLPATVPDRAVVPAVWAGGARAVEPAQASVAPAVWSGSRATGSGRVGARPPGRTLGPGRFFPIVFGPRPAVAAAATATAAAAPPRPAGEFRPAPPKRGRGPAVLGVTRPIPGAVSTHKMAAASSRAAVTPIVAPAPGRIAFMAGGWLAPAAEPAAGSTSRPAGAVRPVRRIAVAGAPRPPPD